MLLIALASPFQVLGCVPPCLAYEVWGPNSHSGESSSTELYPSLVEVFLKTRSHGSQTYYTAEGDFELLIFLHLPDAGFLGVHHHAQCMRC